jgi:hypothetical protein
MATTYSNQIPLDQLKSGDSVLFGDKLNWQSPDVQKLIGQGSANWNYDASNNPIGINVTKPYIAPTTQYTPEALNNLYGQVANAYKGIDTTQYQDLLNTQQQALLGKQAELGKYDIGTQQAVYGLEGQGRGITSGLVAGQQEKLQRQRSLQRLGMAQDVENLQNQYQMAQSNVANIINTQKYNQELEQQKLNSLIGIAEKIKADETAAQEKKVAAAEAVASEEKQMVLNGYRKLKPSDLKNYTEADIIRFPNGDIWAKPDTSNNATVNAYVNQIRAGKLKLDNVPSDIRNDVAVALNKSSSAGGGVGGGVITSITGNSYDIGSYATDPNHEIAVQKILNNIGQFKTIQDIDNYIKKVAPNSPITGQMVANASAKYGVDWETIVAIMQQDSSLGTKGAGARSFNPGNVGNTETATSTGQLVNFGSWQSGVDAVAKNLSSRKTSASNEFDQFSKEQIALSVLPVQTRNSEVELKRALDGINAGLARGLTPYEIADSLMGYKINNPDNFSATIRGYISQSPNISSNDPAEFARLINSGNKAGVVKKIETSISKGTDTQQIESAARYAYDLGPKIYKEITAMANKFGLVAGNWNKLKKKVSASQEFQRISSELVSYAQEWRKQMSGTAVTETELRMIDELLPSVTDNPINLQEKIKSFAEYQLNLVNARRGTLNLPKLDYNSLLDYNTRVNLYENNDDPMGIK